MPLRNNRPMELFSEFEPVAPPSPRVLTVTELTRSVRNLLETAVGRVWVEGEVCNFRRQGSGHQYFGLKDDNCQVSCVWFHRQSMGLRQVALRDGMAVQVRGEMTVYEARGQYQIIVDRVQPAGLGSLQARFEALKRKLHAEGLFETSRKRALPKFAGIIGVVTSPAGAAIQDILNILQRRAPWVRVIVSPARVQGPGAAEEIAAGIREFNRWEENGLPRVDVIVAARGGGSAEDLWAFNEEAVARAIFGSEIPIVSAVGHEIDFTIADLVADVRAPTPSAAAELVVPDGTEINRRVTQFGNRLRRCAVAAIEENRARLLFLERGELRRAPRQKLAECAQRVDALDERLRELSRSRMRMERQRLAVLIGQMRMRPLLDVLQARQREVQRLERRVRNSMAASLVIRQRALSTKAGALRLLSPLATLERGYSITTTQDGKPVISAVEVSSGEVLRTRVRSGELISVVK